jgi:hypothetical protein
MSIFKGLNGRRLYKSFGVKGLTHISHLLGTDSQIISVSLGRECDVSEEPLATLGTLVLFVDAV